MTLFRAKQNVRKRLTYAYDKRLELVILQYPGSKTHWGNIEVILG